MNKKYAGYSLVVAAAVTTALSGAVSNRANAQEATAGYNNDDNLDTVFVTARRREERSQDVPLAVSVLTAEAIESTGTFTVGKLSQLQPSIQFVSSNPRNSATTIRGLGAPFGLTNDGIEQGVGIYIDQVYYSRAAAATFDFLDIEQIEILRGPQGTLYGKNTTAGAINVTSRKPTFDPEARVELTGGNLDFTQFKGSVSGALIGDSVAYRLGTSYTNRRGTIFNTTTNRYINDQENLGFKAQLLWAVSDSLEVTFSGDFSHQDPECCGTLFVRTGSTQRPLNRQYSSLSAASGNYAPPSFNPFDRLTDLDSAPLTAEQHFGGASALVTWDVGPGTLTSVTAYRKWDWGPSNDRDFTGLPITTKSNNPSTQRQWTQEVRYAAAGDHIDYVAGIYGFYQKIDTDGVQQQGPSASRWLLTGANANDPSILNGLTSNNDIGLKNTSVAAFGQFTWKVTDSLRLQPGLRANYDKKEGKYIATVTNATNTPLTSAQLGVLAPQSYAPEFSDTNVSGDFTVSYDIAQDILGYATYAHTFKSGGINLSGLPLVNNVPDTSVETVKPETVNHYEVGLKTQFFARKVTLNVAGFWTVIDDYQATVNNSQTNVIRGYLANADQVQVRGVEVDLAIRPTEQLNVYINGAYNDHEYKSFPDAPCPPELSGGTVTPVGGQPSAPGTPGGFSPLVCDISGQWLPGISNVSASYGAEYLLPLPLFGQDGGAFIGFDGTYRSKFSSNPSRSIYMDIESYTIANFRAGYRADSKWEVYGWARNAFDEEYFDFLTSQSGSTGLIIGQPGDARTYGLTVKATF